jgi:hypothetical protein
MMFQLYCISLVQFQEGFYAKERRVAKMYPKEPAKVMKQALDHCNGKDHLQLQRK